MKYLCLFSLFFFLSFSSSGQGNPHFFKFIFENEKGEILLTKFKEKWEVPGKRFVTNTTIDEFIDIACASRGLENESFELKGIFTFHHEVRDKPTMMFYFLVKVNSTGNSYSNDIWLLKSEAINKIDYGEMREIVSKINEEPQSLHGGKVIIRYIENRRSGEYEVYWKSLKIE